MTRSLRILLAAFSAVLAIAAAPVQGQSTATVTFNDPNCASWAMTQNGSSFTLTCQTLTCSISANPPAPTPTQAVNVTATCVGSTGSTTYTWTRLANPSPGICPVISSATSAASLAAPGLTQIGCVYKVVASDPVNGGGSANITLNWTSTPPASPAGCSVSFTAGSASLPVTGGAIGMNASCAANTNSNTTWSWTKNGSAFGTGNTGTTSIVQNDTLPANALTTPVSTTYQVTATNAGATPTIATQVVTVAGTTGGGGGFDLSACTPLGYTGHGVDIAYPVNSQSPRVWTATTVGNFGPNDMIVVRFVAAASEVSAGSSLQLNAAYQSNSPARVATLATAPCVVATGPGASGQILASTAGSQGPIFQMSLTSVFGLIKLTPGQTYYVNYVNRVGYNGANSCLYGDCPAYIDFIP